MRQQKYEQALKDIRGILQEGNEDSTPYSAIAEAVAIINRVLHRPSASDMTDEERGASIARDEANNHSGY